MSRANRWFLKKCIFFNKVYCVYFLCFKGRGEEFVCHICTFCDALWYNVLIEVRGESEMYKILFIIIFLLFPLKATENVTEIHEENTHVERVEDTVAIETSSAATKAPSGVYVRLRTGTIADNSGLVILGIDLDIDLPNFG